MRLIIKSGVSRCLRCEEHTKRMVKSWASTPLRVLGRPVGSRAPRGISGRQIQRYTPLLARKETAAAAWKQRARKANQPKPSCNTFGDSVSLAAAESEAITALWKRD